MDFGLKNTWTENYFILGDGFECFDIDECATGIHQCDVHAICTNTEVKIFLEIEFKNN